MESQYCPSAEETRRLHRLRATMMSVAYTGAAVHFALIALFALAGADGLALLNVASSAVWIYCIGAVRRGEAYVAVPLALAEVYVHAVACMATLGLAPGFQHFLWAAIPFIVFNNRWSPRAMVGIAGVFALTFGLGSVWFADRAYPFGFGAAIPFLSIANVVVAFGVLTLACLYFRNAAQLSQQRLRTLAHTDPLTGLYNRRRMAEGIGSVAPRGEGTVALGDIDHFKVINDSHGHECGDAVIREVARRLRRRLRKTDFVARWGGDEFLIVLPDSDTEAAKATIESICSDIAGVPVSWGGSEVPVSMTFGVVRHRATDAVDATVRRADRALYRGKEAGRNCVMVGA